MKISSLFVAVLVAALLMPASASAAVVAGWDMGSLNREEDGNFGPSPFKAAEIGIEGNVSGLTRGEGLGTEGDGKTWGWGASGWDSREFGEAARNGDFFSFSVTSESEISYSSIGSYNVVIDAGGPTFGVWQYSITSDKNPDAKFETIGERQIRWEAKGEPQAAIDLSEIEALQKLTAGSTVTFRLLSWGGNSSAGLYLTDFQERSDFTLNGDFSSVPEPSNVFAGLLIGCGLLRRRRVSR